ncbi:MAG: histidine phosphotransferase family protein [Parvularcula sp.]|jgi:histidine phosphotransferase ChpT|nr:histidine phosphotransferase family protein [Parvularcula sp.]
MNEQQNLSFASLLASRLCHDLINPAGALSTALDVLDTESDVELRDHAESLLREATTKLVTQIEYARIAFGAAGGGEGQLDTETLRRLAERLYAFHKAELRWRLAPAGIGKAEGRALMNLLLAAERIAPRPGSVVSVEDTAGGFVIIAEGRKAKLPEDMASAFAGDPVADDPKLMPARLAALLAEGEGKSIRFEEEEDRVTLSLR